MFPLRCGANHGGGRCLPAQRLQLTTTLLGPSRPDLTTPALVRLECGRRQFPAVAVLGDEVDRRVRMPVGERARGLDHAIDDRAAPELVDRPDRQLPPVTLALARGAVLVGEEGEHLLACRSLG